MQANRLTGTNITDLAEHRKTGFKNAALSIAALGVILALTGCKKPTVANKPPAAKDGVPNIVLIYTDDLDCESIFGTWPTQPVKNIRFPNIKLLAESGVTFNNFHVTTPVCGPSRACLFSGQYAHRNGIRVNSTTHRLSNGFPGGFRISMRRTRWVPGWRRLVTPLTMSANICTTDLCP